MSLVLVMLAGAGGGYLYVNKLQKDNAILKTNQIKLETFHWYMFIRMGYLF